MEKEKNKTKRSTEEILICFFPKIDREALRELLKDDVMLSPSKKRKSITDEVFLESAKKFKNTNSNYFLETENEKLDKIFSSKEKNYINTVKKAVTTLNLPNPLGKLVEKPSFLTSNIKKIYAITGKAGYFVPNRLRVSALKNDDVIFTLYVTGSDDTDFCYKLLINNFCNKSEYHKAVFVFIVPKFENDKTLNYKNKKDIIINRYSIDMRNLDTDRFFFSTEPSKPQDYPSNLAQYYKHCAKFPFSFSLFGFCGLKGPKGDKKELENNLKFLMKYHKEPFILCKCDLFENKDSEISISKEEIRSYSWLFVFDRINNNCFNCFKSFSKLVDFKKDKVSGLTLLQTHMTEDDIKPKFTEELNQRGIKKFNYDCKTYEKESCAIVKNMVNFGNENYDFVVIYNSYNNSEVNKGNYEKQSYSNYQSLMECLSNICVHNGI
jgi:hypothetical protein